MKVLVCGGRDFNNAEEIKLHLSLLHSERGPFSLVIQGGARGADSLAMNWAQDNNIPHQTFYANWRDNGRAAGALRNQTMLLEGKPDLVVAFPGGRGTADMVYRSLIAGVETILIPKTPEK
jgi:hypothetical protein